MRLFFLLPITLLLVLLGIALPQSADAQSPEQPAEITAVYACKNLPEPMARLECYDNAVGRLEAAEESGEVVTISKTEVEKVKKDAFGFNIPSLPKLGKLFRKSETKQASNESSSQEGKRESKVDRGLDGTKSVILKIKRTDEFGYGKTRFFFSNGQVWEQTKPERIRIPKVRNGEANNAEISKAALGSFLLRVNGKGRATRVRRVR